MAKIKIGGAEVALKGPLDAGRPVVFAVHGAGGGAWLWDKVRERLQAENLLRDAPGRITTGLPAVPDVVAIDLPGHCESSGDGRQTISEYRDIAREAASGAGIKKPFAMGHSMGGAIVLDWAISHPEELSGIILVSTGAKLKVHPMVFDSIAKNFDGYLAFTKQVAFGPGTSDGIIEACNERFREVRPETVTGDFRACDAFNAIEQVGQISLPTLILCGSEDKLTPRKYSEFLASKIKSSTLHILEGAGHMLPVERAEAVADLVRQFAEKGARP